MKNVIKNSKFSVYDNVLEKEYLDELWKHFQQEPFSIPHLKNWLKIWRPNDGTTYGSNYYNKKPESGIMSYVWQYLVAVAEHNEDIIGKRDEDWNEMRLRFYFYPRGSKISWHNDFAYTGAMIYYVHPHWGSTWGGELFIAETDEGYSSPNQPAFDRSAEDKFLSENGLGYYIMPKSNRIVVTKGGIWHSTNRVDDDAGDNCRCSIVTFFMKI